MTDSAIPSIVPDQSEGDPPGGLRIVEPQEEIYAAPAEPLPIMPQKIALLGEVELKVEVVLGRARRTLQELLEIRPGQAVELDRQRNSPVEILVNGRPFALGEIVVIDDSNLGVRILEVLEGGLTTVDAFVNLLAATHTASTTLAAEPSIAGSLFKMVFALALVIALIWLATKVLASMRAGKFSPVRSGGLPVSQRISVISRQSLGKGLQLAVVRWGEREVLVGIAGQTITFLNDFPTPGPNEDKANDGNGASGPPTAAGFAELFGQAGYDRSLPSPANDRRSVLDRLRDATARPA